MPAPAPERLRVGVTGHRWNQLPEAARPALAAAVESALVAIGDSARAAGHPFSRLALISGLAEGADRIAAQAALKVGWRLDASTPFALARYVRDFGDAASVAEFHRLWAAAARRRVIDGEALQANDDDPAPYAALARSLAADADALIAVWNGKPPAGAGGTAEVAALSVEAGKPVVWISPDGTAARLINPATPSRPHRFRARWLAALAERFPVIAPPSEMRRAA